LHAVYRPQAVSFLLRLGVRPREADDACQDIFLQVFRYLHRFEGRADFRTWFYKGVAAGILCGANPSEDGAAWQRL